VSVTASLNWSFVQHCIGDMHDDEEYQPVRVLLPDGTTIEAVRFEKDARGRWVLVACEEKERS